jgi:uncharacterized protein YuzE
MLKIKYDPESDVLYVILSQEVPVDAIEEPEGIIISYAENGKPVSLEFLNASLKQLIKEGELNLSIQAA